ncbi:pyridoxamine 5'-phosphate oxidase family protein [Paenibacillus sp. FSL M7-1046]|uniref:pyridoxamine 5'-phosphate oxidase family protein n=1 Tax=Paenibacillus sp. FSL M7-1046 TaxID=2975315 RepID=UPI0030F7244C
MDTKREFLRMMAQQTEIALATIAENRPKVRIVNFYYDDRSHSLFFSTFADNQKVNEIEKNNRVAFTTIPSSGNEHVKAEGLAVKSAKSIHDVQDGFIHKIPDYKNTIEQAGDFLILFEIKFETAIVTLDFENTGIYSI